MSFLAGPHFHTSKAVRSVLLAAGIVAPLIAAVTVFALYQVPESVRGPSLVLKALGPASKAGDVWGFDIYLAKKTAGVLDAGLQKPKILMAWLFAAKILEAASWDRPLDDLKRSFYIMQQESIKRLSGPSLFLFNVKGLPPGTQKKVAGLDDRDAQALKSLREEDPQIRAEDLEKRCRELLKGNGADVFKARLIARAAYLEEQKSGKRASHDIEQLEHYRREGALPLDLSLTVEALRTGPVLREKDLAKKVRNAADGETGAVLAEYQRALERLSARDYNGFVEKVKTMAATYSKRDFAPVLLHQALGVLEYDLKGQEAAKAVLSDLQKDYPISDWSRPEKIEKAMTIRGPQAKPAGQPFQPPGFLRGFFKSSFSGVIRNLRHSLLKNEGQPLSPEGKASQGREVTRVFDEGTINGWMEAYIPPSASKILTGYKVTILNDGVDIYAAFKAGPLSLSLTGQAAVITESGLGGKIVALKVRELKIQNVAVPRFFLEQVENDFADTWRNTNIPLEVLDIQYAPGEVRITVKRKPS